MSRGPQDSNEARGLGDQGPDPDRRRGRPWGGAAGGLGICLVLPLIPGRRAGEQATGSSRIRCIHTIRLVQICAINDLHNINLMIYCQLQTDWSAKLLLKKGITRSIQSSIAQQPTGHCRPWPARRDCRSPARPAWFRLAGATDRCISPSQEPGAGHGWPAKGRVFLNRALPRNLPKFTLGKLTEKKAGMAFSERLLEPGAGGRRQKGGPGKGWQPSHEDQRAG